MVIWSRGLNACAVVSSDIFAFLPASSLPLSNRILAIVASLNISQPLLKFDRDVVFRGGRL
jgi:hypothetical protein